MIVEHCEQGSPEWRLLHVGIPTASSFDRIITPTGKPSASRGKYLAEKVAEYFYGDCLDAATSQFMDRGRELEPRARACYELDNGCEVDMVGMILRGDRMCGCSPDGLVRGQEKGVEFKAYELVHHVAAALKSDREHYVQVQGCLWLTGYEIWDRVYYHPRFPATVFTFERDEDFIEQLAEGVDLFIADMMASRKYLEDLGWRSIEAQRCPDCQMVPAVCG